MLVNYWGEAIRLTQTYKIKDVSNNLISAKFGVVGTLSVVSHVPIDIPHAYRGQEQEEPSQPSTEASPPPPTSKLMFKY